MRYKEAYALVIDAHKLSKDEHDSLHELLNNLNNILNGFTPYDSYIDEEYSDDLAGRYLGKDPEK